MRQVRGYKSSNNVSLKTIVKNLEISVNNELKDAINSSLKDLCATLFIKKLNMNKISNDYTIDKIELENQE